MIRLVPIRSCSDADCPKPWVEFSAFAVNALGVTFTIFTVNGPAASPECKTVDEAKERTIEGSRTLPFDVTAIDERHTLALTLDGDVEFVPLSKQRPIYYAHLAFVDPVTGDADVLAFEREPFEREP